MYKKTIIIRSNQQALETLKNIKNITGNIEEPERQQAEERLRSVLLAVSKIEGNDSLRFSLTKTTLEGDSYRITVKVKTDDNRGLLEKIRDLFR